MASSHSPRILPTDVRDDGSLRGLAALVLGSAPLAGAKAGASCVFERVVDRDIGRIGMARRAGRAAIDPGRRHRIPEFAICTRIAREDPGPARVCFDRSVRRHKLCRHHPSLRRLSTEVLRWYAIWITPLLAAESKFASAGSSALDDDRTGEGQARAEDCNGGGSGGRGRRHRLPPPARDAALALAQRADDLRHVDERHDDLQRAPASLLGPLWSQLRSRVAGDRQ